MKKLLKNEVNMRRHLGIDFSWNSVGFGRQVGRENRAKMVKKPIQKYIQKVMKRNECLETLRTSRSVQWGRGGSVAVRGFQVP